MQCLALAGIANIGGQMLTDAVGASVIRLLTTGNTPPVVRKKAALTCHLPFVRAMHML